MPFAVVVLLGTVLAGRADAATYCVGVNADGCVDKSTAAAAFSAARADTARDTILLGRLTETGSFADAAGRPVRVVGVGADATRLRDGGTAPALRLTDPGSSARELRADSLELDGGAEVSSATTGSRVVVTGGQPSLSSVVAPGLTASCARATLRLELDHVTLDGTGESGIDVDCAVAARTATVVLEDSIVWGFTRAFTIGTASAVRATYSDYAGATGDTNMDADPRFQAPGDARLRPDSPLIDRGHPGPLSESEPHQDALGYVRIVDGNGDGTPRRDVGALEFQPPAPFPLPGNVLTNGGAEAGTAATDDTSSPAPPGWTRTGAFTSVRYGTVAGLVPFPTRRVSEVLAAGDAFFAGGPGKGGTATQLADVRDAAPEIDMGKGTIALSAALGGYRSSTDGAIAEATFRGPAGGSLGSVRIGPVTAADRGGATTLLPRRVDARIPPLTRTIAVTLRSTTPAGSYDDAYFDSVSLVPRTGGRRPHSDPTSPKLRSFLGATVISRRVPLDSRRRAWVRIACAARTVKRCHGTIALTARIGKKGPVRRIARRTFSVRRGRSVRLPVRLGIVARRAVFAKRKLRHGRVYTAARDGQGLTRDGVAVVKIVRGTGLRSARR